MPGGAEIPIAAVGAGPETRRRRRRASASRRGSPSRGSCSSSAARSWRRSSHRRPARSSSPTSPGAARSRRSAPRPAACSAATSTAATCCRACSGGVARRWSWRRSRCSSASSSAACSACSAATSAARSTPSSACVLDVFLSIPAVILALALVTILRTQPGTERAGGLDPEVALIIALGIVSIPVLGRITRASTLSWSEREFVLAAKAQGAKHRRIIFREVLPERAARDVLDRAARHRGGDRRRGHARHPRRERRDQHAHVGQHDRHRAQLPPTVRRTSCSSPR